MASKELNEVLREEWRDLGFYYEQDDEQKLWIFRGSRDGLLNFSIFLF